MQGASENTLDAVDEIIDGIKDITYDLRERFNENDRELKKLTDQI